MLSYNTGIVQRDGETPVLHLGMLGRDKGITDSTAMHISIPPGHMEDTPAHAGDSLLAQVTLGASCCYLDSQSDLGWKGS